MRLEKYLTNLTEKELFILLKNNFYPDLTKFEDNFSRLDCYTSKNYIELKCRREHYNTQLIEKEKYLALKEKQNSLYITSTPKGVYIFDIYEIEEPIWRIKYLPASTEFRNKNYIEKEIGELPITKAIEITQILFPNAL
jgi:hypothetical protein